MSVRGSHQDTPRGNDFEPRFIGRRVIFSAIAGDHRELDRSHAHDLAELHSPRHRLAHCRRRCFPVGVVFGRIVTVDLASPGANSGVMMRIMSGHPAN